MSRSLDCDFPRGHTSGIVKCILDLVLAYPLVLAQGGLELPAEVLRAPRAPAASSVANQLRDCSGPPTAKNKKDMVKIDLKINKEYRSEGLKLFSSNLYRL